MVRPLVTVRAVPRISVCVRGASLPVVAAPSPGVVVIEMGVQGRPGEAGPPGPSSNRLTGVLGVATSALRCVRIGPDGMFYPADPSLLAGVTPMAGVTLQAGAIGATVEFQRFGALEDAGFAFAQGSPVYCGAGGVLTTIVPAGVLAPMGWALTATKAYIRIDPPIL